LSVLADRDAKSCRRVDGPHRDGHCGWRRRAPSTGQTLLSGGSRCREMRPQLVPCHRGGICIDQDEGEHARRRTQGSRRPTGPADFPHPGFPVISWIEALTGKSRRVLRQNFPVPSRKFPVRSASGIEFQAIDIRTNQGRSPRQKLCGFREPVSRQDHRGGCPSLPTAPGVMNADLDEVVDEQTKANPFGKINSLANYDVN
jgi:hypothetical protein